MTKALDSVLAERKRQYELWGKQHHESGTSHDRYARIAEYAKRVCDVASSEGRLTWKDILIEEVYEAISAPTVENLREELVQVAAVALQWVEHLDQEGNGHPSDGGEGGVHGPS